MAKKDSVVGTYKERSYEDAKADPKTIEQVEDRQPDQIADYHDKHPTLKATTKAHREEPPTDVPGDGKP